MKLTRKQLRKAIILEMQNNDLSHYYPKLAMLLLHHDHMTLKQAIGTGEALGILRLKSDRPGGYRPNYTTHQYELMLKADFAEYLQQNYPNPPKHHGPSHKGDSVPNHHYINYQFLPDRRYYGMSISIHIEWS